MRNGLGLRGAFVQAGPGLAGHEEEREDPSCVCENARGQAYDSVLARQRRGPRDHPGRNRFNGAGNGSKRLSLRLRGLLCKLPPGRWAAERGGVYQIGRRGVGASDHQRGHSGRSTLVQKKFTFTGYASHAPTLVQIKSSSSAGPLGPGQPWTSLHGTRTRLVCSSSPQSAPEYGWWPAVLPAVCSTLPTSSETTRRSAASPHRLLSSTAKRTKWSRSAVDGTCTRSARTPPNRCGYRSTGTTTCRRSAWSSLLPTSFRR